MCKKGFCFLYFDISYAEVLRFLSDPSAVRPVLNPISHAIMCQDGVSENYHSQGLILSRCLQTSAEIKQVDNQMTDETLPFADILGYVLVPHCLFKKRVSSRGKN